jgi:hypothetical protein
LEFQKQKKITVIVAETTVSQLVLTPMPLINIIIPPMNSEANNSVVRLCFKIIFDFNVVKRGK